MELTDVAPDLARRFGVTDHEVLVCRQGNFTLALLYDPSARLAAFGISKRNVCDREQFENGARLAIARACRSLKAGQA